MAEAIDTLQIADDLEAAGLERQQAKAIAHAVRQGRGDLATKGDLAELATKAELATLETRLTWRMLAIAGFIIAAIKLLPPISWA